MKANKILSEEPNQFMASRLHRDKKEQCFQAEQKSSQMENQTCRGGGQSRKNSQHVVNLNEHELYQTAVSCGFK